MENLIVEVLNKFCLNWVFFCFVQTCCLWILSNDGEMPDVCV